MLVCKLLWHMKLKAQLLKSVEQIFMYKQEYSRKEGLTGNWALEAAITTVYQRAVERPFLQLTKYNYQNLASSELVKELNKPDSLHSLVPARGFQSYESRHFKQG